jgi:hypothetical protein
MKSAATLPVPSHIIRLREGLMSHPVYREVQDLASLRLFMQHHVFAVWDFMSLLKRLQRDLTGLTVPWYPRPHPRFVRLVNEIVLGEESDLDGQGGYLSHFELYRAAMVECGADTELIDAWIRGLQGGGDFRRSLAALPLPPSVRAFVSTSLRFALEAPTWSVAAAFFYGREEIIPDMFRQLLLHLGEDAPVHRFRYYLERHIAVDSTQHGPWAAELLQALIDGDREREAASWEAAQEALMARAALWDGVVEAIGQPR